MKSHIPIEKYLETIRIFQSRFPSAHVGGSIGLFLHGIDLQRPLTQSDIDMTIDDILPSDANMDGYEQSSAPGDFDGQFRWNMPDNRYIKIELRVSPEPSFETIEYKGETYNVSKKRDIIFWKTKYAKGGHKKHIDDLIVINGGERPVIAAASPVVNSEEYDDLPF